MTDRVDVAALRAIISRYRRAMIDRDAASACKRAGDMLDASHRAAEAARDMMNAAPSLLAEVEQLRAESKRLREALTGPVLSRIKNFQERDEHYAVDWAAVCSSIKSEVEAALAAQEQAHA